MAQPLPLMRNETTFRGVERPTGVASAAGEAIDEKRAHVATADPSQSKELIL